MAPRRRFQISYAPIVKEHLRVVERVHYSLLKEQIELHLLDAPEQETAQRKRLGPTTEVEADWELRCGPNNRLRVFYRVDMRAGVVEIVGIGVKRGSKLRMGGEEVGL